jgi:transcriptional regulator with XRE-family HTH domain
LNVTTYPFKDFRAELDRLGLTQKDFADMIASTPQVVSKWKFAKRGVPRWAKVVLWLYAHVPARSRVELLK